MGCALGDVNKVARNLRGAELECEDCPGLDDCESGKIPQFEESAPVPAVAESSTPAPKKRGRPVKFPKTETAKASGPVPPAEEPKAEEETAPFPESPRGKRNREFDEAQYQKVLESPLFQSVVDFKDSIIADFAAYPDLLAWVKEMAVEDVRSPGQEIIALLKYTRLTYAGDFEMMRKGA